MRGGGVVATAVLVALAAGCDGPVGGSGQPAATSGGTTGGGTTGVVHKEYQGGLHTTGRVKYPDSPPMGGQHNPHWADCTGTVYRVPVANENAVHSMEHGAVWITYRPGLTMVQQVQLAKLVEGKDYTMMSPYPGLDRAVSVQSWGYQLKTDDPADPQIAAFVQKYRRNPKTAPEPAATCVNPNFPGA